MPDSAKLVKARMVQLNPDFSGPKSGGKAITVQFNPDTLKVSFANQIATPEGAGSQRGTAGRQFVGRGTTKLAVQLWFDVNHPAAGDAPPDDVRDLTKDVAFFITPEPDPQDANKFTPPAVRFEWGSFSFDGIMEALEETLELFSAEGRPLRASASFTLSQQKIAAFHGAGGRQPPLGAGAGALGSSPVGTTPLTTAPAGTSLQSLAEGAGNAGNWQAIAAANGIENPRLLVPGQLVNLAAGK